MSSITNTLLQYFLIVAVAYLYAKAPWANKKTGSSSIGGTLGKIRASGLAEYYAEEKKRTPSAKKSSNTDREAEQKDKAAKVDLSDIVQNDALRMSTRGSILKKQQSKRSSSGSPTPSSTVKPKASKQDLSVPAKQQSSAASTPKKNRSQKAVMTATTTESNMTASEGSGPSISVEEAAKHCRFLSEMFKDVPMSEIDRVIRSAHWDIGEAASMLIQEDYTWQCVRRRRSVP
ncbi:hypothetical protein BGX28_006345, partial [Mortierella sp. GBA30]